MLYYSISNQMWCYVYELFLSNNQWGRKIDIEQIHPLNLLSFQIECGAMCMSSLSVTCNAFSLDKDNQSCRMLDLKQPGSDTPASNEDTFAYVDIGMDKRKRAKKNSDILLSSLVQQQ